MNVNLWKIKYNFMHYIVNYKLLYFDVLYIYSIYLMCGLYICI